MLWAKLWILTFLLHLLFVHLLLSPLIKMRDIWPNEITRFNNLDYLVGSKVLRMIQYGLLDGP